MKKSLTLIFLLCSIVSFAQNTTGTITDKRDGKVYKTVVIGSQTWMAENLNVSKFRNGDPIPEVKTKEEWEKAGTAGRPGWCYFENDPKNGAKYGKLYNWYAVNDPRGLAPAGWHIPTATEWIGLENHLGEDAGEKMKSLNGWNGYDCKNCNANSAEFKKICSACKGTQSNSSDPFSGNGTNSSGFSGLPGGDRNDDGYFNKELGNYGFWWSIKEYNTYYDGDRTLSRSDRSLRRNYRYYNGRGLSVRCVKD
jgi:uncharacterized protein (TIGR02145 family)